MLIVFGARVRQKVVDEGQYLCPQCGGERPCRRIEVARYFTLFWIPVCRVEKLGEFGVCEACQTAFEMVDDADLYDESGALETWKCPGCAHSNPNNTYRCANCHASLV